MNRLAVIVILVLSAFCNTQRTSAQTHDESSKGPDYERALIFFHQLQSAVKANDRIQVEHSIHYPVRVNLHGHLVTIRRRSAFITNYPQIFTTATRDYIAKSKDTDLWWRDQGYTIGNGVVWFDAFIPRGKPFPAVDSPAFWTSGSFGIKTVNGTGEKR